MKHSNVKEKDSHKEWEDSIDGIDYDLCFMPQAIAEKSRMLIIATISKLPKKIREKVLDGVTFVVFDRATHGSYQRNYCSPHKEAKLTSYIFLNLSNDKGDKFNMTTIAHEIAHYILKHEESKENNWKLPKNAEIKADDLCEKWGFGRAYAGIKLKNYLKSQA
jgi:hypothetical protein